MLSIVENTAVGNENQDTDTIDVALLVAAEEGDEREVARLLEAGAHKDKANQGGATPLFMAAMNGHEPVVARLLGVGADVHKATETGATPLFVAAQQGHEPVVARLLNAGADKDKAAQDGATPLCAAAYEGHESVVARLLGVGADVDKATETGATPLWMAAENGHEPVVARLLGAGADVDKAVQGGATPLLIAAQNGHEPVVARLHKAGAKTGVSVKWNDADQVWQLETDNNRVDILMVNAELTYNTSLPNNICAICLEPYDTSDRYRRIVGPCGHVACNQCLAQLDKCHICRKQVQETGEIDTQTTKNIYIMLRQKIKCLRF